MKQSIVETEIIIFRDSTKYNIMNCIFTGSLFRPRSQGTSGEQASLRSRPWLTFA